MAPMERLLREQRKTIWTLRIVVWVQAIVLAAWLVLLYHQFIQIIK